jgi:hypothetical protein
VTKRSTILRVNEIKLKGFIPNPGEVTTAILHVFNSFFDKTAGNPPRPRPSSFEARAERYETLAYRAIIERTSPHFREREVEKWIDDVGKAAQTLMHALLSSPGVTEVIDAPNLVDAPDLPAWTSIGIPGRDANNIGPPTKDEIKQLVDVFSERARANQPDIFFTTNWPPPLMRDAPTLGRITDDALWLAVWTRLAKPSVAAKRNGKGPKSNEIARQIAALAAEDFTLVTGGQPDRSANHSRFPDFADKIFKACRLHRLCIKASGYVQKSLRKRGAK